MTRYAVNLGDLGALTPRGEGFNPVGLLLADFVSQHSPTFTPDKNRIDSGAVILDGPAAQDPQRVEALVELLQTVIGPRTLHRRVRCYREGMKGGWSEVRPAKTHKQQEDDCEENR